MKKECLKCFRLVALAVMLPFIYGCGSGAGIGSLVGFLFGSGGGISGGEIALLGGLGGVLGGGGSGAGLAALHTPEPASMLLIGSGLVAMGYFKSKTSNKDK